MKFDEAYWRQAVKKPDWYLEFLKYIPRELAQKYPDHPKEVKELKKQYLHFFAEALKSDQVALAEKGPDLDEQRLPIDTIVIHHTSSDPGYGLDFLNAVHLLNIYVPYFANPTDGREKALKGTALWSNHFRDGQQVFYGYHWLMRMDGTFERLLEDDQIGWQAGNWEVNRRSIAICLDNDYENKDPEPQILQKLADFIKKQYPQVKPEGVIGHCEARQGTICPGKNFLTGWKPLLLEYLR